MRDGLGEEFRRRLLGRKSGSAAVVLAGIALGCTSPAWPPASGGSADVGDGSGGEGVGGGDPGAVAGGGDGALGTGASRKLWALQAVAMFPAKLGADGKVLGRVCGPALGPADIGDANGVEVVAALDGTEAGGACVGDQDLSVKPGDAIDLQPVTPDVSIQAKDFTLAVSCVAKPGQTTPCPAAGKQTLSASQVRYVNHADRCDPARLEATRLNVALVLDDSGSNKGLVDKDGLKEDAQGQFDQASFVKAIASDWEGAHFNGAEDLIDSLNPGDRVVGYLFDENGAHIASSNSYLCAGGKNDGARCDPTAAASCEGGSCESDPSLQEDDYATVPLGEAECLAFGATPRQRKDLHNGIQVKRNSASGRAALWQTVDQAFGFLTSGGSGCSAQFGALTATHIVVVSDGPDTCGDGDDFSYRTQKDADVAKSKCRTRCASSTSAAAWTSLQARMAAAGWPVHVHFVQFQAPGYLEPDPRMIELACRSDGTYQFIRSEGFNKSNPEGVHSSIAQALARVRSVLSGSWRVGVKWGALTDSTLFAKGALRAVDAELLFANPLFPSLAVAKENNPDSARFGLGSKTNPAEDRRALLRLACTSDADCGGASTCSPSHCGEGGVCSSGPAPDGKPCGTDGKGYCRQGVCNVGGTCGDAVKP